MVRNLHRAWILAILFIFCSCSVSVLAGEDSLWNDSCDLYDQKPKNILYVENGQTIQEVINSSRQEHSHLVIMISPGVHTITSRIEGLGGSKPLDNISLVGFGIDLSIIEADADIGMIE